MLHPTIIQNTILDQKDKVTQKMQRDQHTENQPCTLAIHLNPLIYIFAGTRDRLGGRSWGGGGYTQIHVLVRDTVLS